METIDCSTHKTPKNFTECPFLKADPSIRMAQGAMGMGVFFSIELPSVGRLLSKTRENSLGKREGLPRKRMRRTAPGFELLSAISLAESLTDPLPAHPQNLWQKGLLILYLKISVNERKC